MLNKANTFTPFSLSWSDPEFFNAILPKLGDWPNNRVAELTPTAWQAAQNPDIATQITTHPSPLHVGVGNTDTLLRDLKHNLRD